MQKLLTIVVPVYKVEPYINKCLDSCLIYKTNEQGEKVLDDELMNQLEVIIVNDGTPDNSAEMSREYVKRFPNTFRQIDKENGGHGSAWNVGLKEAKGKYLRFLDSDDWLTNLDKLMQRLNSCEADIVITNYRRFFVLDNRIEDVNIVSNDVHHKTITRNLLQGFPHGYIDINFWSSTYLTSILKPLYPLFAEHVMYDDSILTFAPLIKGRTIECFDLFVYNYLLGRAGQSMSHSVQIKNAHSYVICLQHQEKIRAALDASLIPDDLLLCIDDVVYQYAHMAFGYFPHLPYKEAKTQMKRVVEDYPLKNKKNCSHVMQRYQSLPFGMFYLVEKARTLFLELKK